MSFGWAAVLAVSIALMVLSFLTLIECHRIRRRTERAAIRAERAARRAASTAAELAEMADRVEKWKRADRVLFPARATSVIKGGRVPAHLEPREPHVHEFLQVSELGDNPRFSKSMCTLCGEEMVEPK